MDALKLHDIKPLVEIPDNSIYLFFSLLALAAVAVAVGVWYLLKYMRREKAQNLQKVYLQKLKEIDTEQAKSAAYELTHYGNLLDKDHPQTKAYEMMVKQLESFKYKKQVGSFDSQTRQQIDYFVGLMDV